MPHQCTGCGHAFPDGSKQMLSGCPECDGNKFQFLPSSGASPPDTETKPSTDIIEAPNDGTPTREDRAQATARSTIVSSDELPPITHSSPRPRRSIKETSSAGNSPDQDSLPPTDLAALRAELNDQFESIKILRPGEYELNLMELYDRDEYIVALEEDGRYAIDVPSSWRKNRESDES